MSKNMIFGQKLIKIWLCQTCQIKKKHPVVKSIIYKLMESFWVIDKIISIQVGLIIRGIFIYELATHIWDIGLKVQMFCQNVPFNMQI